MPTFLENQTHLEPFDPEAEKRVCGALILDRDQISDVMLDLQPEHFYTTQGRYIYESICSLHIDGNPVTAETIASHLNGKKELDATRLEIIGGARGIMEVLDGVSNGEVEFWSGQVKKKYEERKLLEFAAEVKKIALSNPEDVTKARAKLEEKLISLSGKAHSSSVSIAVAEGELDARINRYINNPDDIIGLPSTYYKLDEALDGFQLGNVSIVYAPSSRYKSLFTTNIGWRFAQQNIPGLWFTTEMPRVQVMERLLQLESGLNIKWLRRDKQVYANKGRIKSAQGRLSSYPIYFCDTSSLDIAEIRSEVSRHTRWNDIKYILVDLVDHVSSSRYRDEMVNNQRAVMASMKQIAKDFNIHVMLVSHVSKGNEQTRTKADLDVEEMIGSAAKYQDVDCSISIAPVIMNDSGKYTAMTRDEIFWSVAHGGKVEVMISVTKNRHGELLRELMDLDFNIGGRFDEQSFRTMTQQATYMEEEAID